MADELGGKKRRPRSSPKTPRPPRKPEISPTKLRIFLACRTMYRLDYVEKVGRFYHKPRAGFSFGTTLHQALQTFHESGGSAAVSPSELQSAVESSWISQGYASQTEEHQYRQEAAAIVEAYHAAEVSRTDQVETFLTEKVLKLDMGRFVLMGRIDRIDEHTSDGCLEIVDYKSGRWDVTEEDVRSALAMSVYQLLAARTYPGRRVVATIHALRGNVRATVEMTASELIELEQFITTIGDEILDTDFASVEPVYDPNLCDDCDFLRLCTRHWQQLERQEAW